MQPESGQRQSLFFELHFISPRFKKWDAASNPPPVAVPIKWGQLKSSEQQMGGALACVPIRSAPPKRTKPISQYFLYLRLVLIEQPSARQTDPPANHSSNSLSAIQVPAMNGIAIIKKGRLMQCKAQRDEAVNPNRSQVINDVALSSIIISQFSTQDIFI